MSKRPAITQEQAHDAVRTLLWYMGEDPTRPGMVDTPARVARAWREMCRGRGLDPARHLERVFASDSDGMVVVRGIRFTSMCEHHLLPFVGTADVAYIPAGGRVVGLSKIPRVVTEIAAVATMQEDIATRVADVLQRGLKTKGVAVRLVAKHSCMGCRGVMQPDAEAVTTVLRGVFRKRKDARDEFMRSWL